MHDHDLDNVYAFWDHVALWLPGYTHPGFSFLAIKQDNSLSIIQGRLFMHTAPPTITREQFQTEHVVAGYFSLAELGLSPKDLIEKLLRKESVETPLGNLTMPSENGGYSSYFAPYYHDGLNKGNKLSLLRLSGARWHRFIEQPEIDWELKSALMPYDSLAELMAEYWLGAYQGDSVNVEVVALAVAEVDFLSLVQGGDANPAIYLANGLERDSCSLGYRVMLHGMVKERGVILGKDMEWDQTERYQHGVGRLSIPSGAAVQCFATYCGVVHQQGWIADPSISQNPRRAAFEELDDKLVVLKDFLFGGQKTRRDARDFEIGIAWLLWLLGFSTAHAGATSRTSDATDILATTPNGHMALIECTTGHLKADTKLAKLVERTQTIRRRLDASGNHYVRLLPVMVTTLGRDEVKADLDKARDLGIVVVVRDDIESALDRSVVIQNADALFEHAESLLRNKQEPLGL